MLKYTLLPAMVAVAVIIGVEWYGAFGHVKQMIVSLLLVFAAAMGAYLWWSKKWNSYRQQQLEEQNIGLEVKVEERTRHLKHQLYFTQTLLDAIPNPVFFKNMEGRYLGCNKAYEALRGISKADLCGKNVFDMVMPDAAEALTAMDVKLFSGAGLQQFETSLLSNNGSTCEVIYHKACFNGAAGELAGLICVIQDITSLKMAEYAVRRHNEELEQRVFERTKSLEDANYELIAINRELEQRRAEAEASNIKLQQLSRAVENSPAAILITDNSGRIEYVNPKFTEITGYLSDEAVGQNTRIFNAGLQSKEFYRELWDTILAGYEWRGDFCNRKKNGDIHWEHASISPIRDEDGTITHFVAIKEDVTEQKRKADELLAAQKAAHAANRSKSEFLDNMSHELRTPLNAIIGFSSLALKSSLPLRQQDYVRKIQTAGELLLAIVGDILDFSKIEAGQLELEQIPFRLDSVIATTLSMVQQKAQEQGLNLQVDVSPDVTPCLLGDPHQLGQIFLNLLSNAVKFTEQGDVVLKTSLLKRQNDRVELKFSISDTGIGLLPEQISKLFQPFTQADGSTTRRFGGTGLGLSISKRLVELMGGTIWCESRVGQGSSFCFTAWFGIGQADDMAQCTSSSNSGLENEEAPFDFSGRCILLVEDNVFLQELGIELVKESGAVVHLATNGKDAVTMIFSGSTQYDMVLMDIQMPIMDGYEAARIIRLDSRFATLPIIAMTGLAMHEEQQKIMGAGMDAILTKPFDAETFLRIMHRFLRTQETDADHAEETENTNGDESLIDSFDVAIVTPILNMLLAYIKGSDGRAEGYLDHYQSELAGMAPNNISQIKNHLNNFNFIAAHDALLAFTVRHGIMLSSDEKGSTIL